jgi:hypothetical protein
MVPFLGIPVKRLDPFNISPVYVRKERENVCHCYSKDQEEEHDD